MLGLGDLLAQRHALGLDLGGLGGELGDRRRDLLAPRIELDDLALGIGQPLAPAGMILRDLAEPLDPHRGLAGQAIAVAFGLDQRGPQLGDARAQRARGDAVGLGVGDRRQPRLAEGAAHLGVGDVAHDLGHRLLDAGQARAQLVGAARHVGVPVARLGGGALGGGDGAPARARSAARVASPASCALRRAASATARSCARACSTRRLLGIAGRGERGRFGVDLRLRARLLGRDGVDLLADLGQPVALAEPHRRRRRRAGAHGVAVPAPHRAVARDELLAGLEAGLQRGARGVVGDDADEGEAARELGQRLDVIAERRGAVRQRRRIGERAERQPMDRRAAIGRGFELVAERRAQRLLEARLDGQRIEQRRPQRIGRRLQRRGNACFLGAQLGEPRIGLLQSSRPQRRGSPRRPARSAARARSMSMRSASALATAWRAASNS